MRRTRPPTRTSAFGSNPEHLRGRVGPFPHDDPAMLDARTPVRYGRRSARPHRTEEPVLAAPIQTTLDVAIPLDQVTFCVVDLETTGGSPTDCRITEVGAVKYRGGERIGAFQALVDPEISIPPFITQLTGIDDRAVSGEPPIEEILPAFLEFCRGAVFVAHNARFDFSFLNANLTRLDYDRLPGPAVCTAKLARRVVWPDVPNVRLLTLVAVLPHASRAQPPGLGRCRGLRRGPPRAPRPGRAARHPDARRPARGGSRPGTTALRQDPAGRPPAACSRRVPVPRSRRPCAVRGQVEGPAGPGEVVLLRRRAQEGRRPLVPDDVDRRRALRVGDSRRWSSRLG